MKLMELGWGEHFERHFGAFSAEGLAAGRVAREDRHSYLVYWERGELVAEVAGRMRHEARGRGEFPAVGDWVAISPRVEEGAGTIRGVLPRKSRFSRKVAGGATDEQIVAANVDSLFLVCGLDHDFNPRRIERYLTPAWDSGATPVIVLNKADVCGDVEAMVSEVEGMAVGVAVHAVSAKDGRGLEALGQYFGVGRTVALLGSSGVGKSTLINRLLGVERQEVQAVRGHDSHGRHTTTCRELLMLPGGGMLIDTPGMREMQLWDEPESLGGSFEDVERIAGRCRFRDCRHGSEPGCAIRRALEEGELDAGRYENYVKLQRELKYLAMRQDHRAQMIEKAKWKKINQAQKQNRRKFQ